MSFCPVTRDLDDWMERNRERPWSGRVRITLECIPDKGNDTVIECDFELDDASSEESVITQIKEIVTHQMHIEII